MSAEVIQIDPQILNGTPVFKGTRVPVEALFDHLETGLSIDDFLQDFPSVSKENVVSIIEIAGKAISSKGFKQFYETAS